MRDWQRKEEPLFFSGRRIYDYMDGAGELPLSYRFRVLGTAWYQKDDTALEVVIFDMGDSASAFGYYSIYHSPNDRFVQLDHRAKITPGYILVGWKDHYTVVVQTEKDEVEDDLLIQFAKAVMANIKERGEPPDLLRYLPRKDYIENSARYARGKYAFDNAVMFIAEDVFNLKENVEVAAADYHSEASDYRLVLLRYPKPEYAAKASRAFFAKLTESSLEIPADDAMWIVNDKKDKWVGAIIDGQFVGVALRAKDEKVARTALETLRQSLKQPADTDFETQF